jgi:hypothetical protein
MERISYFENIRLVASPLLFLPGEIDTLIPAVANQSIEPLMAFADRLAAIGSTPATTRAAFIQLQCKGINTEDLFETYCESWGIPRFEDNLVSVDDFTNGFLFTFRDHTSSWSEDEEAREWFYTHPEARFARRYEFWGNDNGPEEMVLMESGDYKNLLWAMVKKHADYSPFISPVFSKEDLRAFFADFDEYEYDFDKSSLLRIMTQNPNW